ncbi:5'-3' exonuclease [Lacrimispora sp.]|uniref:5'-3' exonuclease n=1 Tax=Lacrimispora sp. TaxID=2719234 RepID=UPI00044A99DB|nr:5'-3' exonuclease H3TH domain-containing protein [Lacrimispora sp.]EXG87007.1 5'-3' exonuclease (including N-terminal domain of PolI) [Clostridium sp. ASBs410]MDR7812646.1 5'-3' exonuclease H3TH domain-containing protein [Lacrimispora sp.]
MSERKFVVVDGSSMLSTCYYAVLPREIMFAKSEEEKQKHYDRILHAKDGTYTNAIFGMLKMVVSLMKKQQPDHIAFVFDKTRDTFRRELYPDYKGTRGVTPEPLKSQFVLMEEILKDVGFQVLLSEQYEADDYAGSLVMKFREEISMILLTKDHDYLQLVNDEYNVRAWMVQSRQEKADELYKKYYSFYGVKKDEVNLPEKVFEYTSDTVLIEEGVRPEQIADLKGIQGDPSDNIPGVKGVSSAAPPLLREYGTVEEIYRSIHEAESDKKSLKALQDFWKNELGITRSPYKSMTKTSEEELCGEKAALLSKTLATMKMDIPIDMELEDFSAKAYQEEKVKKWLKSLDIKEASIFGTGK